jgi:hypothetical protein
LAVAAVVERVLRLRTVACSRTGALILEQMLFEPFEGHGPQEPRRHDAIRVDVVAAYGQRAAFNVGYSLHHEFVTRSSMNRFTD